MPGGKINSNYKYFVFFALNMSFKSTGIRNALVYMYIGRVSECAKTSASEKKSEI